MILREGALIGLQATSKDETLRELSAAAARLVPGLDGERVHKALLQRESLGATSIGGGVALPHTRVEGIEEPLLVVGRSDKAILYHTMIRRQVQIQMHVRLQVLLLGPPGPDPEYLRLLGRLGRILRDRSNLELLLSAREPEQIRTVFTRMLQSAPAILPEYPTTEAAP